MTSQYIKFLISAMDVLATSSNRRRLKKLPVVRYGTQTPTSIYLNSLKKIIAKQITKKRVGRRSSYFTQVSTKMGSRNSPLKQIHAFISSSLERIRLVSGQTILNRIFLVHNIKDICHVNKTRTQVQMFFLTLFLKFSYNKDHIHCPSGTIYFSKPLRITSASTFPKTERKRDHTIVVT